MALEIGKGNNGLGINSFSGPMGEKEPAYGAVERMRQLTALAPIGSPQALQAPRRAKRAAVRGKKAQAVQQAPVGPPGPTPASPPGAPQLPADHGYQMGLQEFWSQMASDPNASPLVKQYAAQVLST